MDLFTHLSKRAICEGAPWRPRRGRAPARWSAGAAGCGARAIGWSCGRTRSPLCGGRAPPP
eukprot:5953231-Pyramimonas_sp.AAC.1